MFRMRLVLLLSLLAVSACTKNVWTAPNESDCDFFGNCRCNDWYDTCSGHEM